MMLANLLPMTAFSLLAASGSSLETQAYFAGQNALKDRIQVEINDSLEIRDEADRPAGQAFICAGGADNINQDTALSDLSRISAATDAGLTYGQQDGYYFATMELSAGLFVKVMAVADGLGSFDDSHIASSAFLQGVHAGVIAATRSAAPIHAILLYGSGHAAVLKQRKHHKTHKQTVCTGTIAVVVGDQGTVAAAGDSMLAHSRRDQFGFYQTLGYTHVDCTQEPHILSRTVEWPATLYSFQLIPGDRLTLGSDGFWENILGQVAKIRTSRDLSAEYKEQRADAAVFYNLDLMNAHTTASLESARYMMELSFRSEQMAREIFAMDPLSRFMDWQHVPDNITVIDYEQGRRSQLQQAPHPAFRHHELEQLII